MSDNRLFGMYQFHTPAHNKEAVLRSLQEADAVQILSCTASEALKYYDIQGSAATQTLLIFMDRFFDMLNVRSKEGRPEGI